MDLGDRMQLEYWRTQANYNDCVFQAQRVNMDRKLEHWADNDALWHKALLHSVFGHSTRVRVKSFLTREAIAAKSRLRIALWERFAVRFEHIKGK